MIVDNMGEEEERKAMMRPLYELRRKMLSRMDNCAEDSIIEAMLELISGHIEALRELKGNFSILVDNYKESLANEEATEPDFEFAGDSLLQKRKRLMKNVAMMPADVASRGAAYSQNQSWQRGPKRRGKVELSGLGVTSKGGAYRHNQWLQRGPNRRGRGELSGSGVTSRGRAECHNQRWQGGEEDGDRKYWAAFQIS